jgi:hypothetical protein
VNCHRDAAGVASARLFHPGFRRLARVDGDCWLNRRGLLEGSNWLRSSEAGMYSQGLTHTLRSIRASEPLR